MHARIVLIALPAVIPTGPADGGPVTSAPNAEWQSVDGAAVIWSARAGRNDADVPSFPEIANKQDQTKGAIMAHIVLPKHPKSEPADLVVHILSLREEEQ